MAKMTSLSGSVVGKLGGNVFSINSGQQLVRAYQPNVSNPSTVSQVSNRSKFKLASQLAAAVSPVLAIKKTGLISGRNQFVSETMKAITENQGTASVPLANVQLTKSTIDIPILTVVRGENNTITCRLAGNAEVNGVSKVIYAVFLERPESSSLVLQNSVVVSEAGVGGNFLTTIDGVSNTAKIIVYAYGIIEGTSGALAKYDDYQVSQATFIASLISSRSISAKDLRTTITRYQILEAQQ